MTSVFLLLWWMTTLNKCGKLKGQFKRAGTRQHCRNNVTMFSGPKKSWLLRYIYAISLNTKALPFFVFVLSLMLYYVVALPLSPSLKIVACPALRFKNVSKGLAHQWDPVNTPTMSVWKLFSWLSRDIWLNCLNLTICTLWTACLHIRHRRFFALLSPQIGL